MDKDKQNQNGGEVSSNLEDNLTEIREQESAGAEIEEQLAAGEAEYKEMEPTEEEQKGPQRETAEKKTNAGLITLVVVLALALAAAVGWGVWQMVQNGRQEAETGTGTGTEKDEDDKHEREGEGAKVEEVALDDPVVQRLWHNFDAVEFGRVGGEGPLREASFYINADALAGNPSKELMTGIALQTIPEYKYCEGWLNNDYGDSRNPQGCYDGDRVRVKIKEIFGKDVTFQDGDIAGANYCGRYEYSAKNHEFYAEGMGCGGNGGEAVERGLYKAEREGDKLYLYEGALGATPGAIYHIKLPNDENELLDYDRPLNFAGDDGYILLDHLDEVDQFKWTFKKNADGEYVFAGLERL